MVDYYIYLIRGRRVRVQKNTHRILDLDIVNEIFGTNYDKTEQVTVEKLINEEYQTPEVKEEIMPVLKSVRAQESRYDVVSSRSMPLEEVEEIFDLEKEEDDPTDAEIREAYFRSFSITWNEEDIDKWIRYFYDEKNRTTKRRMRTVIILNTSKLISEEKRTLTGDEMGKLKKICKRINIRHISPYIIEKASSLTEEEINYLKFSKKTMKELDKNELLNTGYLAVIIGNTISNLNGKDVVKYERTFKYYNKTSKKFEEKKNIFTADVVYLNRAKTKCMIRFEKGVYLDRIFPVNGNQVMDFACTIKVFQSKSLANESIDTDANGYCKFKNGLYLVLSLGIDSRIKNTRCYNLGESLNDAKLELCRETRTNVYPAIHLNKGCIIGVPDMFSPIIGMKTFIERLPAINFKAHTFIMGLNELFEFDKNDGSFMADDTLVYNPPKLFSKLKLTENIKIGGKGPDITVIKQTFNGIRIYQKIYKNAKVTFDKDFNLRIKSKACILVLKNNSMNKYYKLDSNNTKDKLVILTYKLKPEKLTLKDIDGNKQKFKFYDHCEFQFDKYSKILKDYSPFNGIENADNLTNNIKDYPFNLFGGANLGLGNLANNNAVNPGNNNTNQPAPAQAPQQPNEAAQPPAPPAQAPPPQPAQAPPAQQQPAQPAQPTIKSPFFTTTKTYKDLIKDDRMDILVINSQIYTSNQKYKITINKDDKDKSIVSFNYGNICNQNGTKISTDQGKGKNIKPPIKIDLYTSGNVNDHEIISIAPSLKCRRIAENKLAKDFVINNTQDKASNILVFSRNGASTDKFKFYSMNIGGKYIDITTDYNYMFKHDELYITPHLTNFNKLLVGKYSWERYLLVKHPVNDKFYILHQYKFESDKFGDAKIAQKDPFINTYMNSGIGNKYDGNKLTGAGILIEPTGVYMDGGLIEDREERNSIIERAELYDLPPFLIIQRELVESQTPKYEKVYGGKTIMNGESCTYYKLMLNEKVIGFELDGGKRYGIVGKTNEKLHSIPIVQPIKDRYSVVEFNDYSIVE